MLWGIGGCEGCYIVFWELLDDVEKVVLRRCKKGWWVVFGGVEGLVGGV